MLRSFKYLFVSISMWSAGTGCVLGLAVGLWSALGDEGAGVMLARGGIALTVVLILSLILGLVLAHLIQRGFDGLHKAVGKLQQGQTEIQSSVPGPAALGKLSRELVELGLQIEKRHRHADEQNAVKLRLEKDEALLRFSHGVIREVQKPLAGVIGFVELASRQGDLSAKLRNYLNFIDQEARSGREALDRILRYCREEPFSTEPVDVNGLLAECSRGVAGTEEASIQMDLDLSKNLPKPMASPGALMQVFNTLFDNARDALLPEGGRIQVNSNRDAEGMLMIMIRDDGRGIPTEDQPKVFSPYFSSKGTRKGAGLNLALADRIIQQHGGKLEFHSSPGQGTVFFVKLPVGDESS
ncbi:MAG: HAMP domain-containing histidine kinase [Deltaproteobacteria bacterium]|nr:HAMP domain-containing histidine kinase [Deltaproteobacteria bacterium]